MDEMQEGLSCNSQTKASIIAMYPSAAIPSSWNNFEQDYKSRLYLKHLFIKMKCDTESYEGYVNGVLTTSIYSPQNRLDLSSEMEKRALWRSLSEFKAPGKHFRISLLSTEHLVNAFAK